MLNLPYELRAYILCRETLAPVARLVCKFWRELVPSTMGSKWYIAYLEKNKYDNLIRYFQEYAKGTAAIYEEPSDISHFALA